LNTFLLYRKKFKPLTLRGKKKDTLPTIHIYQFCSEVRLSEANIWRWNYTIIS